MMIAFVTILKVEACAMKAGRNVSIRLLSLNPHGRPFAKYKRSMIL